LEHSIIKWEPGRQGGGYRKLALLVSRFPIPWDIHLIHMPEGSFIAPHKDPFIGCKMYRVNVVLRASKKGGEFICARPTLNFSRLKFFRPDIQEHGVSKIESGSRLVFSFGWCW